MKYERWKYAIVIMSSNLSALSLQEGRTVIFAGKESEKVDFSAGSPALRV